MHVATWSWRVGWRSGSAGTAEVAVPFSLCGFSSSGRLDIVKAATRSSVHISVCAVFADVLLAKEIHVAKLRVKSERDSKKV